MSPFFRLGLTGSPLAHSLSPRLHQAALQACGLEGEYRLYPIPPLPGGQEALAALVHSLRQGDLDGLNVTIPHKRAVLPLVDSPTPTAQAAGAVNTLYRSGGQIVGDNTDVEGFWNDLREQAGRLNPGQPFQPGAALVLGAGGAARAVVYALAQHGWQVTLAARRPKQAQQLTKDLAALATLPALAPIALPQSLAQAGAQLAELQFDLLVNATPLGMSPLEDASAWLVDLPLPPGCWVYDLVYRPPITQLMRLAHQQGLPAVNGLGMLVHQAALAFLRFTRLPETTLPRVLTAMQAAIEP